VVTLLKVVKVCVIVLYCILLQYTAVSNEINFFYVDFRSGGPGGKAFGEGGEREKWIIIGLVGTVALLGTLAYYEMGYKEIAWKEFVNK
jgi:hypothetical protein